MDRVISLLAALVGLIALGGAILVHVNADAERQDLAAQIAEIRTSLKTGAMPAAAPSTVASAALASAVSSAEVSSVPEPSASQSPEEAAASSPSPSSALDAAGQISALQAQVAELEQQNASQASALADAEGRLAAASSSAPAIAVQGTDALSPSALAPPSASASAGSVSASSSEAVASGPSTDCIPLGTRFVGKAGDKFPICHSKVVVKILGVSDGQAVIDGAGPIATGGFGNLSTAQGCTVMVFTADVTGYADLRVTCQ